MQHFVDLVEIKARAEAIGLSLKVLGFAARVDPSSLYRMAKGADYKKSTALKVLTPLVAKEKAVLAHLCSLYPDLARRLADGGTLEEADDRQTHIEDFLPRSAAPVPT